MKNIKFLEGKLTKIERLVRGKLYKRVLFRPVNYAILFIIRHILYPVFKKGIPFKINTIWQFPYWFMLPASADILLFRCKTSLSDIYLTRYFMRHFKSTTFIDIGANFGYYSLIAAQKNPINSQIIAIEPNPKVFRLLLKNVQHFTNIIPLNIFVANENSTFTIHEFPPLYAEYNTVQPDVFLEKSDWIKKNRPQKRLIQSHKLDDIIIQRGWQPDVIKLDIENGEFEALLGLENTINTYRPRFILRYWYKDRDNSKQMRVIKWLIKKEYQISIIDENGMLIKLKNNIDDLHNCTCEYIIMD